MSTRYTLRLYKGVAEESFRAAALTVADRLGGRLKWRTKGNGESRLRTGLARDTLSVYVPYQDLDFKFCCELGGELDAIWMEIRIQEGALWDYSLYNGRDNIDNFSPWPQYWFSQDEHASAIRDWAGDARLLSRLWAVPLERIERYILNWGWTCDQEANTIDTELKGKAYPNDECVYGDCFQFWDFMRSIGAVDATEDHCLVLPQKRAVPWYRRWLR